MEGLSSAGAYTWTAHNGKGTVYGRTYEVEVDVAVTGKKRLPVGVKSGAGASDVPELTRTGKLYEMKEGVRPELAIVAGSAPRRRGGWPRSSGSRFTPTWRSPSPRPHRPILG